MTSCGKLFQSLLPATGNAPVAHGHGSVTSRVGRTVRPTMMNAGADGWSRRRDVCHRIGSAAPDHEDTGRGGEERGMREREGEGSWNRAADWLRPAVVRRV